MTEIAKKVGQYVVLIGITVLACGVMWFVSGGSSAAKSKRAEVAKPALIARPKALVAVDRVLPQTTELTLKQSGVIRAWEDYSLGFEVAGRVESLGVNADGKPLDDGDRVSAGQVLARLDSRIYAARKAEAVAQFEKAASDIARDRRLFETGRGALTEAVFQQTLAQHAVANAQQEVAIKNLEDTVLVSPVDGAIYRRMVEPGESVSPHQTVFEVVENDKLLLIVDVPESRVRELEARKREVERARGDASVTDPEEKVFRARVFLEGRDAFGSRWPAIDAEVYRIAQVADQRTKLFEVEVLIPNDEGLLRPGMVATTEIVTKRLLAYQAPELAVMFRGDDAFLFTVQSEPADAEVMFWKVGDAELNVARRVDLKQWVDEGDSIVIPADTHELGPVVIRGQQRLSDGQHVRVVNPDQLHDGQASVAARAASFNAEPQATAAEEAEE